MRTRGSSSISPWAHPSLQCQYGQQLRFTLPPALITWHHCECQQHNFSPRKRNEVTLKLSCIKKSDSVQRTHWIINAIRPRLYFWSVRERVILQEKLGISIWWLPGCCFHGDVCACLSGLSVDRPCARSVKVDCPCVFSQVCVRGGVVWALSEHKALFYREGLNSYCSEGEGWKYDTVRYYCCGSTGILQWYCCDTAAVVLL